MVWYCVYIKHMHPGLIQLFYIPIVLSVFFWGNKGIITAAFLGAWLILDNVLPVSFSLPLNDDIIYTVMFITISSTISFLRSYGAYTAYTKEAPAGGDEDRIAGKQEPLQHMVRRNPCYKKLCESEDGCRKLIENLPYAVIVHDGEKILFANRVTRELGGVSHPSGLIGRPITELIHFEYHDFALKRIAGIIKRGEKAVIAEEKVILPDGSLLDVEVSASEVEFEGQSAVLAMASDISQRKKIENELRISEEKYRTLFNNANDMIFLHKFEENGMPGVFAEVNDTACQRLEYSRKELLCMSPADIDHKDMIYKITGNTKVLFETDRSVFETVHVTKSGREIPVEISAHIFMQGGERMAMSIARDVTERKKFQNELQESEERYKKLVELSPDSIFILHDYSIEYANSTGAKLLGVSSADLLSGKPVSEFIHPDYSDLAQGRVSQIQTSGCTVPAVELKIVKTDGTVVDIESTAASIHYKGRDYFLVYARDISYRKRIADLEKNVYQKEQMLSQAEEYERIRSEFFANLSHEFRTPIHMVFASTQVLEMYLKNDVPCRSLDGFRKQTKIMKQNIFRLIRLINNLIDITKIEAQYFELYMANCDIVKVVEDITLSAVDYTRSKGIELIFDTDVEEKVTACDPDIIERIMLNLLSNAIKFTKCGGSICVRIHDMEDHIQISIKDTGTGIPPGKTDIIFQRFRQVDQSLSRGHEGSGIGLSLVKSLVEMHNGHIWVESDYGKGTEFFIKLPARLTDEKKTPCRYTDNGKDSKAERISIEFSDIYPAEE